MPEGRPYSLGNTSADQASINATSEMSASARMRPSGRVLENPRAVSYENDGRYAPTSDRSRPMRRSIRADRANCWPDAGFTERRLAADAFLQKTDQGRVDLVGAFLLDPVAGAFDDELLPQVRQHPLHVGDALGADQTGDDGILRSRDEQRRLVDLRVLPRRGQFPVAVDVAIPVEPAAKAGFPVGLGEIGEVGLAEPIRQRPVGAGRRREIPCRPRRTAMPPDRKIRARAGFASSDATSRSNSASATPGVWKYCQ